MPLYGYARVSSEDQDLSLQMEKLKAAGCEIIRSEKRTGTTRESRRELETVLEFLRPGDTLVVTRIDRLARSVARAVQRYLLKVIENMDLRPPRAAA